MRLCVLGNSHVGSLKRAWDAMSNEPSGRPQGLELVFFAHRSAGLAGLRVDGSFLVPATEDLRRAMEFTSGGLSVIDLGAYDRFLVYGLGLVPAVIAPGHGYSRAVLRAALLDVVKASLSFAVLTALRQVTDKPVYLGHEPLPAAVDGAVDPTFSGQDYIARVRTLNEIYRPLGAQLVPQPLSTVVNGRYTRASFSVGSRRLAIGDARDNELHPVTDRAHMNEQYGALWLHSLFHEHLWIRDFEHTGSSLSTG